MNRNTRQNFREPPIKKRTPRPDYLVQSRNLNISKRVQLSSKPSVDYDNSFKRIQNRIKSGKTESDNDVEALRNDLSIFLSSIVRSSNLDPTQADIINTAVKLIHVFNATQDDPLAYERMDLPAIMNTTDVVKFWKLVIIWIYGNWDKLPTEISVPDLNSTATRTPLKPILEYIPLAFKGTATLTPVKIDDLLTMGKTKIFMPQFIAIVPINTLIDSETGNIIHSEASKEVAFSELLGTKKFGYVNERKKIFENLGNPDIEQNVLTIEYDMNRPFKISELRNILLDPLQAEAVARGIAETERKEYEAQRAGILTGIKRKPRKARPPPEAGEAEGEIEEAGEAEGEIEEAGEAEGGIEEAGEAEGKLRGKYLRYLKLPDPSPLSTQELKQAYMIRKETQRTILEESRRLIAEKEEADRRIHAEQKRLKKAKAAAFAAKDIERNERIALELAATAKIKQENDEAHAKIMKDVADEAVKEENKRIEALRLKDEAEVAAKEERRRQKRARLEEEEAREEQKKIDDAPRNIEDITSDLWELKQTLQPSKKSRWRWRPQEQGTALGRLPEVQEMMKQIPKNLDYRKIEQIFSSFRGTKPERYLFWNAYKTAQKKEEQEGQGGYGYRGYGSKIRDIYESF